MKKTLLLFLLSSSALLAQKSKDFTIYLDSTKTNTIEKEYEYYRIVKDYYTEKELYEVTQYYKTGEIESEGLSKSKDIFNPKGLSTTYYKNGNKKTSISYNDSGLKEGVCTFWYENGQVKLNGEFITVVTSLQKFTPKKTILKINNYWNSSNAQTVIDGNGDFEDDGQLDYIITNSISTGKVSDGFKEGVWSGSNSKLKIQFTENFKRGVLVSGKSIDSNKNEYLYEEVSEIAKPRLGIESFYQFVGRNFRVPELKKKAKVVTKFTITSEGKITNVKTIVSIRKDVDEEAINVIKKFDDFIPGKFRGIAVDCPFTIPITLQSAD